MNVMSRSLGKHIHWERCLHLKSLLPSRLVPTRTSSSPGKNNHYGGPEQPLRLGIIVKLLAQFPANRREGNKARDVTIRVTSTMPSNDGKLLLVTLGAGSGPVFNLTEFLSMCAGRERLDSEG